jgi:hypothetical protein
MKRFIWFIFIILIAVPVFAQDDGEGGGGGPDGGAFADEAPAAEIPSRPKIDPMADLKSWLAKASAPAMSKSQEKSVRNLYDRLVKEMRDSFKKQYGVSLDSAIAAQSSPRGRRGGASSPVNPVQSAEITRLTDSLRDKVIASLRMDQQAPLRRYQSEQLRVKEVALLKQKLKAAGIILSADQDSEVDAIYARKSRLRTLAIIEAKGESYEQNITILNQQSTQRVVHLLNSTQMAALSSANKAKFPAQ